MKKFNGFVILAIITVMLFSACGTIERGGTGSDDTGIRNEEDDSKDSTNEGEDAIYTFEAEVIDSKDSLLITPDEESNEIKSSDRISVAIPKEVKILNQEGSTISREELKPGDILRISYNGAIAESYPAQITAFSIELIDHDKLIDGYLALIDDVYQEDPGLNGEITTIALDTSDWKGLSDIRKEIILSRMKELYELDILEGTFDELAEQGLIDKENLYFPEGILIDITEIVIEDDNEEISCNINKWRSGLGAIGWDAKAKLKKGSWVITRDNMWIS